MRTYIKVRKIEHPRGGEVNDLIFSCNCGKDVRVAEVWSAESGRGSQPPVCVDSLNLHLLAQCMAVFNYEHASCPDE